MNTLTKKVKRSDDLYIQFTDDELKQAGIKPGDKFSYEVDGEGILLKKFVPIDVDISEWSRDILEMLVTQSIEKDLPVNDIICNILEEQLSNFDV